MADETHEETAEATIIRLPSRKTSRAGRPSKAQAAADVARIAELSSNEEIGRASCRERV